MIRTWMKWCFMLLGAILILPQVRAAEPDWAAIGRESFDLLGRYVRIDTTNPPADVRGAASFLEGILRKEGVDVRLYESSPGHVNLLARLPATAPDPSRRPILLLQHMDVVPVDRARWTGDPFSGVEEGGYILGRGSADMKSLGVIHLEALLLLKRSSAPRNRDLLLLATADEESGGIAGARWMIANHWGEMNPEFVFDEGGFGARDLLAADGRLVFAVSVAEKRPLWLKLSATGTAAHASQPLPDNAVERLDAALARILEWRDSRPQPATPPSLRALNDAAGPLADNKFTRAIRADTLSLTTLRAGVGEPPKVNVIPSRAEATLDCRLLPGTDQEAFVGDIRRVAGPGVSVEIVNSAEGSPASSPDTDLFHAIERVLHGEEPKSVVVPFLIPYSTDSSAFRARGATAYGFLPAEVDAAVIGSMHGDAERFPAKEMERGVRLMYGILGEFLSPGGR
jgi:acetylornithine deacetylase/succinyl-diaminopimelate desuccinylase-like protein